MASTSKKEKSNSSVSSSTEDNNNNTLLKTQKKFEKLNVKDQEPLELPNFKGEEPVGWCQRADTYFEVNQIPQQHKVPMAMVRLVGPALDWFRWVQKRYTTTLTWEIFKAELIKGYGSDSVLNSIEWLTTVKQTALKIAEEVDRELQCLEATLGNQHSDKGSDETSEEEAAPESESQMPIVKLTLLIVGDILKHPMLFTGQLIEGKGQVNILVSSGTSHNFICKNAVRRLQLPVQPTEEFGVALVTGQVVKSRGVCKKLRLKVGTALVAEDLFNFNIAIEGLDVVLGMAWLIKLGTVSHDSDGNGKMTMSFIQRGRRVELRERGN